MGAIEFIMLQSWTGLQPKMWKRYIDDIFLLWTGTEKELLDFVAHLNKSHALLSFKVNYNFQSKSVEYLDKLISMSSHGFIKTTFYTKPGKKCSNSAEI